MKSKKAIIARISELKNSVIILRGEKDNMVQNFNATDHNKVLISQLEEIEAKVMRIDFILGMIQTLKWVLNEEGSNDGSENENN